MRVATCRRSGDRAPPVTRAITRDIRIGADSSRPDGNVPVNRCIYSPLERGERVMSLDNLHTASRDLSANLWMSKKVQNLFNETFF
jgi:hypothetical protein